MEDSYDDAGPSRTSARFDVLGPVEVWHDGRPVDIGHARQRIVLALLLSEPGVVHPTDQLVDLVWNGSPPPTAHNVLYGYVGRLRRRLADLPGTALTRGRGGYVLHVPRDLVDLHRFRRMVSDSRRTADDGDAAAILRDALRLWRGTPFAGLDCVRLTALAAAVERDRLAALRRYHDLELRLGRHLDLVPELELLADEHRTDEITARHLLIALARSGRRADALDRYTRTREALAEQLGIGPGGELEETYLAILRDEPSAGRPSATTATGSAPPPPPAQLPANPRYFVGREDELRALAGFTTGGETAARIVVIDGLPGVGKTALALHWAHRIAGDYPDGQLYLDLRGYDEEQPPLRPADALATLLRSLHVPPQQLPTEPGELAALFRSLTSGRRVLLVLDNAAGAGQVRPLLPGSDTCLVVVTSRTRLIGLAAQDAAAVLSARPLTSAGSTALLRAVLGGERLEREPQAARSLVELCAGLPLALRIVAANISVTAGRDLAGAVAELGTADRITAFATDDESPAIQRAFDMSYRVLDDAARGLFRALGLLVGRDFTARHAAVLMDLPEDRTRESLCRLQAASMVEQHTEGRYRLHDLLRLFALQRLRAEEPPARAAAARDRLLNWYLDTSRAAASALRRRDAAPREAEDAAPAVTAGNSRDAGNAANAAAAREEARSAASDALLWFELERANLLSTVHDCATHGPYETAWRITSAMRGYFRVRPYGRDWLAAAEAGLTAAERDGDHMALASMHLSMADARQHAGHDDAALHHDAQALRLGKLIGWREGQAAALGGLGRTCWVLGRLDEALTHLGDALTIYHDLADPVGEAVTLGSLGRTHHDRGDLGQAIERYRRALDLSTRHGSPIGEALVSFYLGVAHLDLAELPEAEREFVHSLTVARANRLDHVTMLASAYLAAVHARLGRPSTAMIWLDRASAGLREVADRRIESECRNAIGLAAHHCDDHEPALLHYEAALVAAEQVGYQRGRVHALLGLGFTHLAAGRSAMALPPLTRARRIAAESGYRICARTAEDALARAGRPRR
ncbi:tetratricopeptide repeat protein [Microbispora sp. RL4-1S]|uniref:Tetratricopeptide repeat protein n=1 Tax=Microbispora oryzae TaxID=2806554 RepID=A0A940WMJ9_9ACTN|nr:BTAD domain-containing putative transcriptional regulator [Microbispora oryzae]MBP2708439.1 tetratricopeptide repeat protein [Microbispora oryzae]